jgi:deoxyhypusine synthase
VYEGYVTEKLIDAYAGLTVPLYSGAVSDGFNGDALLNYQDTKDMKWFVDTVKVFDESMDHYQYAYEQPLLKKEPSLNEALAFVYNAVKEMP